MGINWDVRDIPKEYTEPDSEWAITNALMLVGGALGLGGITEKNVEQYAARLAFYQKLRGALMQQWKGDTVVERFITTEDVYRRIGLRTNWSTETDAAWRKRIVAEVFRDAERDVSRELERLRESAETNVR